MVKKFHKPPRSGLWLLFVFIDSQKARMLSGDFEEVYHSLYMSEGKFAALRWYWTHLFISMPAIISRTITWSLNMYKNYLKIALRNIRKQFGYSFINITGLALGMACCILIMLIVRNEVSYDRYHKNADNIYRLWSNMVSQPAPLGPFLKSKYPEVADAVRIRTRPSTVKYGEKVFDESSFMFADKTIFSMFDFNFISGNPETAVDQPFTVVLTKAMAEKYFGEEDPVGKTLIFNNEHDFKVTGVVGNMPDNTRIRFDFLSSFASYLSITQQELDENWGNHMFTTWIRLAENVSASDLIPKIENIVLGRVPSMTAKLTLRPLKDIHLYDNNAIRYVIIFSVVAVLVLLIACINFINLTTARVSSRLKEIGIRKVVGSTRSMLARQFLGESLLIAVISAFLALILVALALPTLNSYADVNFSTAMFIKNKTLLSCTIFFILFTGLAAGIYPAVFLSGFRPSSLIRGTGSGHTGYKKGIKPRKVLVIIQFSISIFLIVCTGIIYSQLEFIKFSDLGYDKDQLVYMRIKGDIVKNRESFRNELLRNPGIQELAFASSLPSNVSNQGSGMDWDGKPGDFRPSWPFIATDHNFVPALGLKLKEGRNFSKEMISDKETAFLVNEKAVEIMKMDSPVGKRFDLWGFKGRIIGVLKNFHFKPLQTDIEPLMVFIYSGLYNNIIVRVKADRDLPGTVGYINDVWNKFAPNHPNDIHFLDEEFERNYRSEQRLSTMFKYFTVFTIFISCLGLFGLVACVVEQRTKEIGIRKSLGAELFGIIGLIGKEFVLLTVISNIIAWPCAYLMMNKWLDNFAYHTKITFSIFLISFIATLILTIITISYQVIKAAIANPVDSLRYE